MVTKPDPQATCRAKITRIRNATKGLSENKVENWRMRRQQEERMKVQKRSKEQKKKERRNKLNKNVPDGSALA